MTWASFWCERIISGDGAEGKEKFCEVSGGLVRLGEGDGGKAIEVWSVNRGAGDDVVGSDRVLAAPRLRLRNWGQVSRTQSLNVA